MAQPGIPGGRGAQAPSLALIRQRGRLAQVAASAKSPFPPYLIFGRRGILLDRSVSIWTVPSVRYTRCLDNLLLHSGHLVSRFANNPA